MSYLLKYDDSAKAKKKLLLLTSSLGFMTKCNYLTVCQHTRPDYLIVENQTSFSHYYILLQLWISFCVFILFLISSFFLTFHHIFICRDNTHTLTHTVSLSVAWLQIASGPLQTHSNWWNVFSTAELCYTLLVWFWVFRKSLVCLNMLGYLHDSPHCVCSVFRCFPQPPLWPNIPPHCVTPAVWPPPKLPTLLPRGSLCNQPKKWPTPLPIWSNLLRYVVLNYHHGKSPKSMWSKIG